MQMRLPLYGNAPYGLDAVGSAVWCIPEDAIFTALVLECGYMPRVNPMAEGAATVKHTHYKKLEAALVKYYRADCPPSMQQVAALIDRFLIATVVVQ